jgi:site-specific DNA-methyltransferase (adenine-specific)
MRACGEWRLVRTEVIGGSMLVLTDCREWLESLPPCFRVDALITDPPYGVGFRGKTAKQRGGGQTIGVPYAGYEDTPEQHELVVIPAIKLALERATRAAITPGTRQCFKYPEPTEIGCFFSAAGTGMGKWGFSCSQPILYYGTDPYLARSAGSRPNSLGQTYPNDANETGHPCAKPLPQMRWLVNRASWNGETVLDPFMGSGTTGVACAQLGRKFIGIEIHEPYFDIACRRIEDAYRQAPLFPEPVTKPEQEALL